MEYVWVGLGGLIGANARYGLGRVIGDRLGTTFPFATLLANVTGSVAIGFILTLLVARVTDPTWRLLIVTGFLGGYTTFSAFSFEAIGLLLDGRWGRAVVYVVGSNLLGLVGCLLGVLASRGLNR